MVALTSQFSSAIALSVFIQKWINALKSHIAYSTYYMHKGVGAADDSDEYEDMLPLSSIQDAIQVSAHIKPLV